MADNFFYIPFINPVKFVDKAQTNPAAYNTKHFEDYLFKNRLYEWQRQVGFAQVWQTTDIIKLQFEATFDPIIVDLLDENGNSAITLPALIGLQNKFIPNLYSFEIAMSLAGLSSGIYTLQVTAGSSGPQQKIYTSGCLYIYDGILADTILLEYWHNRYHEDVIFETGVKFQIRVHGSFSFMTPGTTSERYKDQAYNPEILSSRSFRQWTVHFGDLYGLPDDMVDLLNRIWTCNNVLIDGKAFGAVDGKLEFIDGGSEFEYPKRGVKIMVEEGINRRSKIFAVDTDTTKRLVTSIIVDAKVFGDISNQGSANTVPVINIE